MSARPRKTWRGKFPDDKDLPEIVKLPPTAQKRWGGKTLVVPAPREVDTLMRPVPAAGTPVKPGVYIVRLVVDGREYLREIDVQADPAFPGALLQQELEESVRKMRPQIIE